jgi:hypothetical protein
MAAYRIYPLDNEGRIVGGYDADCGSDDDALAKAAAMLRPGGQAEVWRGTHRVGLARIAHGPSRVGAPRARQLVP